MVKTSDIKKIKEALANNDEVVLNKENAELLADKTRKEIQGLEKDKDFMEFLNKTNFDMSKFENDPEAVKKAHEDYKSQKDNEQKQDDNKNEKEEAKKEGCEQEDPSGDKQEKEELNVGGNEKKSEDEENQNRDETTMASWEKWAGDHNYLFEDTKEKDWEYSFNLYKNKEDMEAKKPSATIKGKGDTLVVKSDDLDVYREIAKQSKEKGYTAINFQDSLSEYQKKMLAIACLENGVEMRNPPRMISMKDPLYKDLPDETKKKIAEYNYNSLTAAIDEKVKTHKKNHPQEAFDFRKELQNLEENALLGAIMLKCAKENGQEIKTNGFFAIDDKSLTNAPEKEIQGLKDAVSEYNKKHGEFLYNDTKEKILKDGKDQTIDLKNQKDKNMQAIVFAICSAEGIKMENVPDMLIGDKMQYLPETVQKSVEQHNKEYKEKVREKEQNRSGESEKKEPEQKANSEKQQNQTNDSQKGTPSPIPTKDGNER